ncbi:MAG: hypothetical protein NPIRA01_09750 [Nitrospirales bacterium]|nr:MAG: hypothetical protein NPIRA01_09750 [Nitrospirales bacterium]
MKQAKVTGYKKTRKPFGFSQRASAFFRSVLRMLIALLPFLPFVAIAIVFFLPQTPHLRVSYTYTGTHEHPIYRTCRYLGVHGTVQVIGQDCPLIKFIVGQS